MSSDTPNPYQSPPPPSPFAERQQLPPMYQSPPRSGAFVGQVRVVCILMAVQGVLELIMGVIFAGMAIILPTMMATDMQRVREAGGSPGPEPEFMFYVMGGIYGAIALFVLLSGTLLVMAAWKNWRFKSRTLGIVALISSAASVLTCYCGFTGIALCVYGLIVYLNYEVSQAFILSGAGHSPQAILAAFGAGPPVPPLSEQNT